MAATSPKAEYTQEVRFAIVMYGGVSLAIYINGIAQELLRLVRSTAEAGKLKDGKRVTLSGSRTDPKTTLVSRPTERVYRQLSYLLSDKSLLEECRKLAEQQEDDTSIQGVDETTASFVCRRQQADHAEVCRRYSVGNFCRRHQRDLSRQSTRE